jgi:hypothetical protein
LHTAKRIISLALPIPEEIQLLLQAFTLYQTDLLETFQKAIKMVSSEQVQLITDYIERIERFDVVEAVEKMRQVNDTRIYVALGNIKHDLVSVCVCVCVIEMIHQGSCMY